MKSPVNTASVIPVSAVSPMASDRSIGALLIDAGKITPDDAERILRYSRERSLRFGDAAIALGLATDADVQQGLSQQFDYPYLTAGQSNVSSEVVAAWNPFSPQVELLRAIRSQLLLRWFGGANEQKCLAMISPANGDGRSYFASNLAVVFSQMGERTLLIDADLRNSRQHDLFQLKNHSGLSSILAERSGMESIQRVAGFVDLSVLTAGPTPPNPTELLARSAFGDLIKDLSGQYDVIIVDTPAAALGTEYLLIAQKCGAVVGIGRRNKSSFEEIQALGDDVRATGATVVGGVVNLR